MKKIAIISVLAVSAVTIPSVVHIKANYKSCSPIANQYALEFEINQSDWSTPFQNGEYTLVHNGIYEIPSENIHSIYYYEYNPTNLDEYNDYIISNSDSSSKYTIDENSIVNSDYLFEHSSSVGLIASSYYDGMDPSYYSYGTSIVEDAGFYGTEDIGICDSEYIAKLGFPVDYIINIDEETSYGAYGLANYTYTFVVREQYTFDVYNEDDFAVTHSIYKPTGYIEVHVVY